jgi:hypothetical protein
MRNGEHHGVVILPARVRRPKDKAKAEAGVQVVQRWILARLRNVNFYCIDDLNEAIDGLLVDLNRRPMKKLGDVRMVSTVLRAVGWPSPLQYWEAVRSDANNAQVMIYANGRGVSYSMAFPPGGDRDLYFVEGSMFYSSYPDGQPLRPGSIAHETLHLYGAWDLYETFRQTRAVAEQAARIFPNDVMRQINDLSTLEVVRSPPGSSAGTLARSRGMRAGVAGKEFSPRAPKVAR